MKYRQHCWIDIDAPDLETARLVAQTQLSIMTLSSAVVRFGLAGTVDLVARQQAKKKQGKDKDIIDSLFEGEI